MKIEWPLAAESLPKIKQGSAQKNKEIWSNSFC